MTVLGVKAPRVQKLSDPSMKLFVEVHNPTRQNLNLKRLEYRLVADSWFDSRGEVEVERLVLAGASAVVEIMVPVAERAADGSMRGVPYTLDARLVAVTDKTIRSWKLHASGALSSTQGGHLVRAQVADLR